MAKSCGPLRMLAMLVGARRRVKDITCSLFCNFCSNRKFPRFSFKFAPSHSHSRRLETKRVYDGSSMFIDNVYHSTRTPFPPNHDQCMSLHDLSRECYIVFRVGPRLGYFTLSLGFFLASSYSKS